MLLVPLHAGVAPFGAAPHDPLPKKPRNNNDRDDDDDDDDDHDGKGDDAATRKKGRESIIKQQRQQQQQRERRRRRAPPASKAREATCGELMLAAARVGHEGVVSALLGVMRVGLDTTW
jgi:hypothetical protein